MIESLTAADFARCGGRDTTPAMEADVLVAPAAVAPEAQVVTPAEVDAFLAAVHRNQFAVTGASPELRRAAAAKVRADIDTNEKRPSYRGKAEVTRQLWRRYHRVNPDNS